ncbi:MAG: rRNA-binding ribosome biosynthesis protein rpf2 [Watsoniomyces obsoletus]|nr:MAG: rRNA-binding ribosome biosynthesis protein rpf2 [Watsoniomyces obsoletus]
MDKITTRVNEILLDPRNASTLAIVKAARNGLVYGAKVRFPHALVMVFLFRTGTVADKLRLILRATRQHARNLAIYASLYKFTLYMLRTTRSTPSLPATSSAGSGPLQLSLPSTAPKLGREARYDTFLAGLIGGYVVFGRGSQSSVNQQITIYVFARVVLALAKLASSMLLQPDAGGNTPITMEKKGEMTGGRRDGKNTINAWPLFASLSWAAVMHLFRWNPETLQPSLRSSMRYMYVWFFSLHGRVTGLGTDWVFAFVLCSYSNADHWDGIRNFLFHNQ